VTTPAASIQTPIETWFGVGGAADHLVAPTDTDDLRAALQRHDPASGPVRVLGDGANLLVADEGVDGLVIDTRNLDAIEWTDDGVTASAGASLQKLVAEACRRGLAGLEGLGGVPASLGGAVRMNAGGAFGEIGPAVASLRALDHEGNERTLDARDLTFAYRSSNLDGLIVVEATLRLSPEDPEALRSRLKDVMAHKKDAQPLAANSAGCVFKNPLVKGQRVSAGRLIDKAGLKGERIGGASVSERHGNFIVVEKGASASDVLALISRVRARVYEESGTELEQELVVWRRGTDDA